MHTYEKSTQYKQHINIVSRATITSCVFATTQQENKKLRRAKAELELSTKESSKKRVLSNNDSFLSLL